MLWPLLISASAAPPEEGILVVHARHDLAAGTDLDDDDLVYRNLPPNLVPDPTFQSTAEVVGRLTRESILAGEPIRAERLAPAAAGPGLQGLIPSGMRASPLLTSDSVAAVTQVADHIDVYSHDARGPCVLVAGGLVLEIAEQESDPPSWRMWVIVTALELELLATAPAMVHIGLRNPIDTAAAVRRCEAQ